MGVSLVTAGISSHHSSEWPTIHGVSPRASEWLPALQERLLPTAARTVRELAQTYDPRILKDQRPRLFAREVLHQRYDVGTWTNTYPEALTRYALRYAGVDPDTLDEREREEYDEVVVRTSESDTDIGSDDK